MIFTKCYDWSPSTIRLGISVLSDSHLIVASTVSIPYSQYEGATYEGNRQHSWFIPPCFPSQHYSKIKSSLASLPYFRPSYFPASACWFWRHADGFIERGWRWRDRPDFSSIPEHVQLRRTWHGQHEIWKVAFSRLRRAAERNVRSQRDNLICRFQTSCQVRKLFASNFICLSFPDASLVA